MTIGLAAQHAAEADADNQSAMVAVGPWIRYAICARPRSLAAALDGPGPNAPPAFESGAFHARYIRVCAFPPPALSSRCLSR